MLNPQHDSQQLETAPMLKTNYMKTNGRDLREEGWVDKMKKRVLYAKGDLSNDEERVWPCCVHTLIWPRVAS